MANFPHYNRQHLAIVLYMFQNKLKNAEIKMYDIFGQFCRRPTWNTFHPSDVQVFKTALQFAVHRPGFCPDAMGDYIRDNHAKPIWSKTAAEIDETIAELVENARTALRKVQR